MTPFGSKVRFLGQLDRDALQNLYANASILVWPGVNEAYGMIYLEAQASGVPVVAQNRPGVRDVLAPANYPEVEAGPEALAIRLQTLIGDPALRRSLGTTAREYVSNRHLMPAATERFWQAARPLIGGTA
jgi:glycosyltransferase involved in cell wall biosynthesis